MKNFPGKLLHPETDRASHTLTDRQTHKHTHIALLVMTKW